MGGAPGCGEPASGLTGRLFCSRSSTSWRGGTTGRAIGWPASERILCGLGAMGAPGVRPGEPAPRGRVGAGRGGNGVPGAADGDIGCAPSRGEAGKTMAVGAMFAGVPGDAGGGGAAGVAGSTGALAETTGAGGAAGVGRATGGGGIVTCAGSPASGCRGPKGLGVPRLGRTGWGAGRAGTERFRLTSPGDGVAEGFASGG